MSRVFYRSGKKYFQEKKKMGWNNDDDLFFDKFKANLPKVYDRLQFGNFINCFLFF